MTSRPAIGLIGLGSWAARWRIGFSPPASLSSAGTSVPSAQRSVRPTSGRPAEKLKNHRHPSFVFQRPHRIDPRSATGWQEAGGQRDDDQQERGGGENRRLHRLYPIQHRGYVARRGNGSNDLFVGVSDAFGTRPGPNDSWPTITFSGRNPRSIDLRLRMLPTKRPAPISRSRERASCPATSTLPPRERPVVRVLACETRLALARQARIAGAALRVDVQPSGSAGGLGQARPGERI